MFCTEKLLSTNKILTYFRGCGRELFINKKGINVHIGTYVADSPALAIQVTFHITASLTVASQRVNSSVWWWHNCHPCNTVLTICMSLNTNVTTVVLLVCIVLWEIVFC